MKTIAIIAFALCSNVASAGLFFADDPKEVMSAKDTARLFFKIEKPMPEVIAKIKRVRAFCSNGGNAMKETVEPQSALLVSWAGQTTIDYIIALKADDQASTTAEFFMNSNVSRQQKAWPAVIDEWFVKGTDACISDVLKRI